MTLTIDKFGRVLIPKPLRKHLMIEPGDKINVEVKEDVPALVFSAVPKSEVQQITFTEWGIPIITGGEISQDDDDLSPVDFIKDTYSQHFKERLGF